LRKGLLKLHLIKRKSDKKTITLQIRGGLGNQLFQWYALKELGAHSNRIPVVDIGWYNQKANTNSDLSPRRFELSHFSEEVQILETPAKNLRFHNWIERVTLRAPLIGRLLFGYFFEPKDASEIARSRRRNINIFGYWICGLNFPTTTAEIRYQVTSFLQKKCNLDIENQIFKLISREDVAVMHIRGSDYLKFQETFINLGATYYLRAIDRIEKLRGLALTEILVFTDDVIHAKEILKDVPRTTRNINQMKATDHFSELLLMSQAKNLICSNSTFSWWGAFLNSVKESKIVFPKAYMVDETSEDKFSTIKNVEFLD
jgi:Glycosyl transferase family 11